jgi:hypothetical protein
LLSITERENCKSIEICKWQLPLKDIVNIRRNAAKWIHREEEIILGLCLCSLFYNLPFLSARFWPTLVGGQLLDHYA